MRVWDHRRADNAMYAVLNIVGRQSWNAPKGFIEMDSSELYKKAFAAQFEEKDDSKAINFYEELVDKFPDSYEAPMAKQQIAILRGKIAVNKPATGEMQSRSSKQPTRQRDPVELLELQVQKLEELNEHQVKQQAQIEQLHAEQVTLNRKISVVVERLEKLSEPKPKDPIKIGDINMPFWSLVGFIVKASIAAIPAYIIVLIVIVIPLVFLGVCSFLGLGVRR
ncbi:hypothetical protein ANRL3_01214 [Anaerolineae bacterium]|nr:hypothetical protein ANRL3_01214 [Anaerolineae bacterium]